MMYRMCLMCVSASCIELAYVGNTSGGIHNGEPCKLHYKHMDLQVYKFKIINSVNSLLSGVKVDWRRISKKVRIQSGTIACKVSSERAISKVHTECRAINFSAPTAAA